MDDLLTEIEALKARWMTGASTKGVGPKDWQHLDPLAQLALAGQFILVATYPVGDAEEQTIREELPALALPALPEALRPLLRRALDSKDTDAPGLAVLLAARGYTINPLDWMPTRTTQTLPPVYSPWLDWLGGNARSEETRLTAENWAEHPPHSRYLTLEAIHREQPEAAREIVAGIAPTLAADQRLRALECLRHSLTPEDGTLMEGFLKDRSGKVRSFAKTQLARLGCLSDEENAQAIAEVSDFLSLSKSGAVEARKLKNDAQKRRRAEILGGLSVAQIAGALGLEVDAFLAQWEFGEASNLLFTITAASGTDTQVESFAARAVGHGCPDVEPLLERLSPTQRQRIAMGVLAQDDPFLTTARHWINTPDGSIPLSALPPHWPDIFAKLITDDTTPDTSISNTLAYLGLLLDQPGATQVLTNLTQQAKLLPIDPRLTLLRLNAAL